MEQGEHELQIDKLKFYSINYRNAAEELEIDYGVIEKKIDNSFQKFELLKKLILEKSENKDSEEIFSDPELIRQFFPIFFETNLIIISGDAGKFMVSDFSELVEH